MHNPTLNIKNNEFVLLNDPKTVWLIKSGSIAICFVAMKNGMIVGKRHYLFSCYQQNILLPTEPSLGSKDVQMIALALENVELLRIKIEYFDHLIINNDNLIKNEIENWLFKIASFIDTNTAIASSVLIRASDSGQIKLANSQTFQTEVNEVIWIKVDLGYGCWLGKEEFTITSETGIVPFADPMHLIIDGNTQLSIVPYSAINSADTLLAGTSWLHKQLVYLIKCKLEQKHYQELQRIKSKNKLDFQFTSTALQKLASPIMPSASQPIQDEAPLLTVAGAVGKALGVGINPPSQSEDLQRLKEPLEAISRASHLRMRQVTLSDQWWKKDCGKAMVAYRRSSHQPVALLQLTSTSYELFEPDYHSRLKVNANVAANIDSVAYIFYRPLPERIHEKIKFIRFALFSLQKEVLTIIMTGVGIALLGMITPYATGILIDNAIPDRNRNLLLQIGLGLSLTALFIALLSVVQRFALLRVETTAEVSTQTALWDKLLKLPVSFSRQYSTGDLHSRVTSVKEINHLITSITTTKLLGGSFALLNLGLLSYYSLSLAILAVIVGLIVTIFTTVTGTILTRKIKPLLEVKGNIFGQIVQLINGVEKLKVAGAQQRAFAAWSQNYTEQIKLELSTQYTEDSTVLFNAILPTLTTGILFLLVSKLFSQNQSTGMTLGTFVAFNAAFVNFITGATNISSAIIDISQIIPLWKRTKPILETLPEVSLNKENPGKLTGKITLNSVCFRYQKDKPLILEKVCIDIEPGEFIALVGTSGSGKSTLLRLLLGFESPLAGTIHYDNRDLASLDITAVRRQMGVVLQSGKISSGSILENLMSGSLATQREVWSALSLAGFAEEVREMPMGINTVVSEGGGNLSGGQRQRLY